MKRSAAVRFALAARMPDEVLDLEELVLGVAALGDPDLDYAAVSAELDRLAASIEDTVHPSAPPDRLAAQLGAAIGGTLGFRGDRAAFQDAAGSYLDVVLARRTGLPILLAAVWMLLGRRLGVPVAGVGYPGHFLACIDRPGARVYVDPFHGGEVLDGRDLLGRVGTLTPDTARRMLEPIGVRPMLVRMLTNLKNLWIDQQDHASALAAVDRILLVGGEQASVVRDRALLLLHLHRASDAARDLRRYLALEPAAADRAVIEQLLQRTMES